MTGGYASLRSSCSTRDTAATSSPRGFACRSASWKTASDVQVGRKRGVAGHREPENEVRLGDEERRGPGRRGRGDEQAQGHGRLRHRVQDPARLLVLALTRGRRRRAQAQTQGPCGRGCAQDARARAGGARTQARSREPLL